MTGEELLQAYASGQRDFHGVDLSGANLAGANLAGANQQGAYLNLSGANLAGANLNGSSLDLSNPPPNLPAGDRQGACVDLSGANLAGANLSRADLRWVNLNGTDLSGADLTQANLSGATFRYANLRGANLYGTNLSNTDVYKAQLGGAQNSNLATWQGATARGVDYNKHYHEVTWAMAHDSHTASKYYSDDEESVGFATDQAQPISAQLAGGIRAVRISSEEKDGDVWLNHNRYRYGTLRDYLTNVRDFLIAHPTEIVTIIDESDNVHTEVAKVYDDLFPAGNGVERFWTGPDPNWPQWPRWPTKDQLQGANAAWPTLNDLLGRNQRLIVFMADNPQPDDPPRMLPAYGACITTSDSGNPLADQEHRPTFPGAMVDPTRDGGALYLLNSYFYHEAWNIFDVKWVNESYRLLNKWSVGDLIIENTLRAWYSTQKRANFLNVDFFQGMKLGDNVNYLPALVDMLNSDGLDLRDQLQARMVGVRMADQNSLVIGTQYTIAFVGEGEEGLNLARDDDGSLALRPADPKNLTQIWQLVYNQASPGCALRNDAGSPALLSISPSQVQMRGDVFGDETTAIFLPYPSPGSLGLCTYALVHWDHDSDEPEYWISYPSNYVLAVNSAAPGSPVVVTTDGAPNTTLWQVTPLLSPPDLVYPVTGEPGFTQAADGRLAIVAPRGSDGLVDVSCDSLPNGDPTVAVIEPGTAYMGLSLTTSDYGNVEMVVQSRDGSLTHFSKSPDGWSKPATFGSSVVATAAPALMQSSFKNDNEHGNLEVVANVALTELAHYVRLSGSFEWIRTASFDVPLPNNLGSGIILGLALVQNAGTEEFELIVNNANWLLHYYRSDAYAPWRLRTQLPQAQTAPQGEQVWPSGAPGLVQRKDGTLHLVVALQPDAYTDPYYQKGGGFAHFVYDAAGGTWEQVGNAFLRTEGWFDAVRLIDNRETGNLEILAHRNTELVRFYRNEYEVAQNKAEDECWYTALTLHGGVFLAPSPIA